MVSAVPHDPSRPQPIPQRRIEVLADTTALVECAAKYVVAQLENAIATTGRATIALSGGSTPRPLYERLATATLDWSKVHIFWGDERYVAPDHPDSNYRMAKIAWLDRVNFPDRNIHPMQTDSPDPQLAAQQHSQELQTFFGLAIDSDAFPQFDVMLLGMGDDGHTASLFPHTAALRVCDQLVTVGEKSGEPRLTLTIPVLNQAALVLFLVAGASKRPALAQVFAPTADANQYPSRYVQPAGNLVWLLDQAAAEGIPKTGTFEIIGAID
jgi:6-phosphogluconolactonase